MDKTTSWEEEEANLAAENKARALEHRKYVDTLRRGDVVRALKDLDPEAADVAEGDLGVVFEESNAYNDEGGPMVRWIRPDFVQGANPGGMCNIYDGDVVKVGQ